MGPVRCDQSHCSLLADRRRRMRETMLGGDVASGDRAPKMRARAAALARRFLDRGPGMRRAISRLHIPAGCGAPEAATLTFPDKSVPPWLMRSAGRQSLARRMMAGLGDKNCRLPRARRPPMKVRLGSGARTANRARSRESSHGPSGTELRAGRGWPGRSQGPARATRRRSAY